MEELMKLCKCGIYLTINEHKDDYKTVKQYVEHQIFTNDDYIEETGADVIAKMVELDTIISVQAYPDTPIGFYRVDHYDYKRAMFKIKEAIIEG